MLEQTATQEFDPFASASDPTLPNFDLWGMVEINAYACALVKGQGKVPFDPTVHDKRFTGIDIYIQPLAEIDVKYPKTYEEHLVAEFPDWAKITLPSIKAAGYANVREINGKWARVARVPNGKKYPKKDSAGNPTGDMAEETTFKFVEFFNTEDDCRKAYIAAGGTPSSNGATGRNVPTSEPVTGPDDQERATAYAFLKVIVGNAAKGKATFAEAKEAVGSAIPNFPPVAKFYNAESVEVGQLITEVTNLLPY